MVKQDSGELRSIASDIEALATEFQTARNLMFEEMAKAITEEDESSAWWGPQAVAFRTNFENKSTDFDEAYDNIISMANNLTAQAEAWEQYENV